MKIVSIATSRKKGTRKSTLDSVLVKKDFGIEGDAHSGPWHRQVSFLASESIQQAKDRGLDLPLVILPKILPQRVLTGRKYPSEPGLNWVRQHWWK
jgi:hypothetical protein